MEGMNLLSPAGGLFLLQAGAGGKPWGRWTRTVPGLRQQLEVSCALFSVRRAFLRASRSPTVSQCRSGRAHEERHLVSALQRREEWPRAGLGAILRCSCALFVYVHIYIYIFMYISIQQFESRRFRARPISPWFVSGSAFLSRPTRVATTRFKLSILASQIRRVGLRQPRTHFAGSPISRPLRVLSRRTRSSLHAACLGFLFPDLIICLRCGSVPLWLSGQISASCTWRRHYIFRFVLASGTGCNRFAYGCRKTFVGRATYL